MEGPLGAEGGAGGGRFRFQFHFEVDQLGVVDERLGAHQRVRRRLAALVVAAHLELVLRDQTLQQGDDLADVP